VAGVPELVMVTPTPDGELNAPVLAAAALAGVDRIVRIGGAQAVGALAFGTATVPRSTRSSGPATPTSPPPSGACSAASASTWSRALGGAGDRRLERHADWVAMDLFSQAEHDEIAQAILLTPDARSRARGASMRRRCGDAAARDHRGVARARGALIRVRDLDEACEIANRIAPEHLELAVADPSAAAADPPRGRDLPRPPRSESLGDYCAGPNHVLPTSRTARFSSPLGVYDFQKRSSVIGVSRRGARARARGRDARARRGLEAHARSAECARSDVSKGPRDLVREEVRALKAYHVRPPQGMVKLDAMENPVPLPASSRARWASASRRSR
jgi:histidinol dehydrogenase